MKMRKRFWPVLLAVLLVMSALASPAMAFTQRTSAPASSNQYYYSNNNPFYPAYVGQCTWYAWGRAYEVSGKRPTLSTGNAGDWYSYTKDGYKRSTTPKAGSVICWGSGQGGAGSVGHVAFVEAVKSDGSVFISEFNWGDHPLAFGTRTLKKTDNAYKTAKYIHIIDTSSSDSIPAVSKTENVKPGVYTIKNVASGRYMNYAWGWKAFNYYPIMIADGDNSPEQEFELQHMGSGQYMLIIKHKDGGVVNIWRGSGSAQTGDPVSQYARNNSDALQKFYLTKLSNGNFIIRCATATGKVIAPESTNNQAYLKVADFNSGDQKQQWVLTEVHTHTLVHTAAKAAACEQAGNIEYWKCSGCGKYFSDQDGTKEIAAAATVLNATGHKWADWKVVREATVSAEGLKERVCVNDASHKQAEEIPKLPAPPAPVMQFTDVPSDAYYYEPVKWAVENNIATGTSATTFGPLDGCTRAHAVTFLWRAAGSPKVTGVSNPFKDVPAGQWYTDAVVWAVKNGITVGTAKDMFSPNQICTRAQIVTFLWRNKGQPAASLDSGFRDVSSDAYFAPAVTWAVTNGITQGIDKGLFGPNENCTRAQIVTFLYRARNIL